MGSGLPRAPWALKDIGRHSHGALAFSNGNRRGAERPGRWTSLILAALAGVSPWTMISNTGCFHWAGTVARLRANQPRRTSAPSTSPLRVPRHTSKPRAMCLPAYAFEDPGATRHTVLATIAPVAWAALVQSTRHASLKLGGSHAFLGSPADALEDSGHCLARCDHELGRSLSRRLFRLWLCSGPCCVRRSPCTVARRQRHAKLDRGLWRGIQAPRDFSLRTPARPTQYAWLESCPAPPMADIHSTKTTDKLLRAQTAAPS